VNIPRFALTRRRSTDLLKLLQFQQHVEGHSDVFGRRGGDSPQTKEKIE